MSCWTGTSSRSKTTAAAPFNPPLETRNLAIVHAAMFDAVNSIARRVSPVRRQASRARMGIARGGGHRGGARGAPAVVSGAAVDVGCGVQRVARAHPRRPGKRAASTLAKRVALRILTMRASDGAAAAVGPHTRRANGRATGFRRRRPSCRRSIPGGDRFSRSSCGMARSSGQGRHPR